MAAGNRLRSRQRRDRHALCRADTCTGNPRPRRAEPNSALCSVCAERLREHFQTVADCWDDLLDQLTKLTQLAERVSGSRDHGLPFNEAVADHRAAVTTWAWFLARAIVDERSWQALPAPAWTAGAVCAWVARNHTDWLIHHQDHAWSARVADQADHYASETRRHAYPSGARRFPVAACPGSNPDDGPVEACRSTLYALIRADATLLPSELFCDGDPQHTYPAHTWMRLGRRLHEAESTP